MIHPPLLMHPNPKRVLIIGGGDGGSIEETLKHKYLTEGTHLDFFSLINFN